MNESRLVLRDGGGAFYICSYEVIGNDQVSATIRVEGTPDRTVPLVTLSSRMRDRLKAILKAKAYLNYKTQPLQDSTIVGIANLCDITGHLGLSPAVIDCVEVPIQNEVGPFTFGEGKFFLTKVKVDFQGILSVWVNTAGKPTPIELDRLEEMIKVVSKRLLNTVNPPSENLIKNAISKVVVTNCGAIKSFLKTDRC